MSKKYIVAPPMEEEDTSSLGAKDAVWGDAYIKRLHGKAKDEIDEALNALKIAVGAPQKADTAADMTDKTKIYVYTGSEDGYTFGAWYYFDTAKNAWTYGSMYNDTAVDTDKTLTASDVPADAKAVGERLSAQDENISKAQEQIDNKTTNLEKARQEHGALLDATRRETSRAYAKEKELSAAIHKNSTAIQLVDNKYASAVALKPVVICDSVLDALTDGTGNRFIANAYLPLTDSLLQESDVPADAKVVGANLESVREETRTEVRRAKASEAAISERVDATHEALQTADNKLNSAFVLKPVTICNYLWEPLADNAGNKLTANAYLPITDATLTQADIPADAKAVGDSLAKLQDETTEEIQSTVNPLKNAMALKQVVIVDKSGNGILDKAGNRLTANAYFPVVDATLSKTDIPADAAAVGEMRDLLTEKMGQTFVSEYKSFGMPILYLNGKIDQLVNKSVTLKNEVSYDFPYLGITGMLKKVKVQGASSVGYPKKNYTLTFDKDFEAKTGWGKHHKYVIKANWVDFSHARNVVCAQLWAAVRKTRIAIQDALLDSESNYITDDAGNHILTCCNPQLSVGINYGAIDGFPIMVVINGKYWGLYSFNVPKDDWMARMDGAGEQEAIVSAETHSVPGRFKAEVAVDDDGNLTDADFSMEYVTDEDNQAWIAKSLNQMIDAVINSTGENYKETCQDYIDIDSAMDYFIFNCLINNTDATDKNYLLQTWDGKKWFFATYDMDGVLGNNWHGKDYIAANGGVTFANFQSIHRMMHLLYTYDKDALIARYEALRKGVCSETNFTQLLLNYVVNIRKAAFNYETLRWPGIPGTETNNVWQILNWYRLRVQYLDSEVAALKAS